VIAVIAACSRSLTGTYPRGLLISSWGTSVEQSGQRLCFALVTDQYPPFSLSDGDLPESIQQVHACEVQS